MYGAEEMDCMDLTTLTARQCAPASASAQPRLCSSCDRCRARKTKCDGNSPCSNCVNRYKRINKVESVEGVPCQLFQCIYSPAKRRGPIPGRNGKNKPNKPKQEPPNYNQAVPIVFDNGVAGPTNADTPVSGILLSEQLGGQLAGFEQIQQQQQQQQQRRQGFKNIPTGFNNPVQGVNGNRAVGVLGNNMAMNNNVGAGSGTVNFSAEELKEMLIMQQQRLNQQQQVHQFNQQPQIDHQMKPVLNRQPGTVQRQVNDSTAPHYLVSFPTITNPPSHGIPQEGDSEDLRSAASAKRRPGVNAGLPEANDLSLPIAKHIALLDPSNNDGNALRSCFELSTNDVLNLPHIPSDDEYCGRLCGIGYMCAPNTLPAYDRSALQAARFSELALGALTNQQAPLALELSTAIVVCLRNCARKKPVHNSCLFEVARAYLLLGIFRSFRGDFTRYFKYRRVCLTYTTQMKDVPNVESLLASVSFHDAWAYMMFNANEGLLPEIDIPRLANDSSNSSDESTDLFKAKYGCSTLPVDIAIDPTNKMWMQGSPPVFLNNEAGTVARALDGFACAVRSCCDQANTQFVEMSKSMSADTPRGSEGGGEMQIPSGAPDCSGRTPTTTAVMANENELCSRNLVLSAKALLETHSTVSGTKMKRHGLTMIGNSMSAFLVDGRDDSSASNSANEEGFTQAQIKHLLEACETVIEHPLLLHSPGPIYHMVCNAAILLCHLINGLHMSLSSNDSPNKAEAGLFDEVLDTYMSARKVISLHRKTLPVKLRCHGLPRPRIGINTDFHPSDNCRSSKPMIDLGEIPMCLCRGCQGFVLMGCSPCVAAERAMKASQNRSAEEGKVEEAEEESDGWDDLNLNDGWDDLNLNDDVLLGLLEKIVQS